VVISGIDTTEAVVVAKQKKQEGKEVWAIPYDFIGACEGADDVCLGVPYFNWGPSYVDFVKAAFDGKWQSKWLWLGPDWKDINNPDTSTIGFAKGPALSADAQKQLDGFIKNLGAQKINLFKGPLNYQDGSPFVKAGQTASDKQVWYMEQLLEGMEGASSAK
jgi:simple sugar transport system substrate-binding protein